MNTTAGKSWLVKYHRRREYLVANKWGGLSGGPRNKSGPGINRCRPTLAYARLDKVLPGVPERFTAESIERLWYL